MNFMRPNLTFKNRNPVETDINYFGAFNRTVTSCCAQLPP